MIESIAYLVLFGLSVGAGSVVAALALVLLIAWVAGYSDGKATKGRTDPFDFPR